MRFTRTIIEVSVEIAADLTVKAEGAVRLAGNSTLVSSNLGGENPLETEIEISGVSEGKGTVSFTVSGARKATDTVVVSVDRDATDISNQCESVHLILMMAARTTKKLTVKVSAIGGHEFYIDSDGDGQYGNVASVSPRNDTRRRSRHIGNVYSGGS